MGLRANPNYGVIKEPRGFIKCLEILLAVFAFSCATGFRGHFEFYQKYELNTSESHLVSGSFKYPFDGSITLTMRANISNSHYEEVYVPVDQRSSTEFFVVIGVFCFIYSVVVLVYYIWFEEDGNKPPTTTINPPVIDFVAGGFWAFFWFVSACAQAAAVNSIKDSTNVKDLVGSLKFCTEDKSFVCTVEKTAKYATLTISILLGFLNVFVWLGNMWFLWKETPWFNHQNPQAATVAQQQPQQHQPTPPAAAI